MAEWYREEVWLGANTPFGRQAKKRGLTPFSYDSYRVAQALATGGNVRQEVTALALDTGAAFVPFATGAGAIYRSAKVSDDLFRAGHYAEFRTQMLKADDVKLGNVLNNQYRPNPTVGPSGSAADALRHTALTGQLVGKTDHIIKVQNDLTALTNLANASSVLSPADTQKMMLIIQDLADALRYVDVKR